MPLSHKLQSGDQVEILTSKSQHVQPSWINFVYTAKAKGKIQAILRRDNREIQKQGEIMLDDWLKANDLELTTSILDKLCDFHDIQKHENFFLALGEKTIILGDKDLDEIRGKNKKKTTNTSRWRKLVPFLGHSKEKEEEEKKSNLYIVGKDFNKKKPVIINEENIGHQNITAKSRYRGMMS